ncbi:MAG: hypothetical protein KGL39_43815 [Patescibacteria group bacterium]|nr:hypothetical protein [Patescibacteria group bacterium]
MEHQTQSECLQLLEQRYREKCATPSDINEHLPTLRRYAENCRHVTELGVRTVVSTWAFLAGLADWRAANPMFSRTLVSVDIAHPIKHGGTLEDVIEAARAARIVFEFIEGDDRKIILPATDLLFIDTLHVEEQLRAELELHAAAVRRWIILHDTQTFGVCGELPGTRGLRPAITHFLTENREGRHWRVAEQFINNHGLTILERT